MKKVIRRNCWETNSSSQHSIIVTKNDMHVSTDELIVNENYNNYNEETLYMHNGKLYLHDIDDGYGRYPFRFLTTFEEKLKYAMCEYMGCFYGDEQEFLDKYNEFLEIVGEIVPSFEDFDINTKDVDIYTDLDGNELKHNQIKYDHYDKDRKESVFTYVDKDDNKQYAILSDNYLEVPRIGMIDHQSMGLLKNFLKDKGIDLKEFLTNKRYVIVIDGDEYCDFSKYLKSGLINKDFILEQYGTTDNDVKYQEWLREQENKKDNS